MEFKHGVIILAVLGLSMILSACGQDKDKKIEAKTEAVAPDRGPVNLGGQASAKGGQAAARTDVPQGYDPAKWDKMPEATKKLIARDSALTKKRLENPGMSGADYMKAAGGGREVQPPKF